MFVKVNLFVNFNYLQYKCIIYNMRQVLDKLCVKGLMICLHFKIIK